MTPRNKVLNFSLFCTALMLSCVIVSGFYLVEGRFSNVLLGLSAVLSLRRVERWYRKKHNQEEGNQKKDVP